MNKLILMLVLSKLVFPSGVTPLTNGDFSGRAYDETQMMDFTPSTQEEIDDYYGDPGSLVGEEFKEYLYDVISEDNYFLEYGSGTSSGVGKYYEITDRNWELSEEIDPATFVFGQEDDDDYYLRLLYSTGNDDKSTAYNNTVNSYKTDDSLTYIDYENELKPNSQIQVDKEHVWAKSHGFEGSNPVKGAGTDLHHLIAADHRTNNIHNNNCYGNVADKEDEDTDVVYCYLADGTTEISGYLGYDEGGEKVFEPNDEYKGDIARALLYMATRYGINTGENSKNEPYLILTDDKSLDDDNDNFTGVIHNLSEMLDWNELDPVDEYESRRNSLIYKNVQNNRNPFVDHPEWARRVFDAENYSLDINLNETYNLHVGTSLSLDFDATYFDSYTTTYDDTYISFNSNDFTITPLKEGETTFTINYEKAGESYTKSTTITIKPRVTITSIGFDELTFMVGDTYTFPALEYNNTFENETITFSMTDTDIATVNQNGLITAVSPGSCQLLISVNGDTTSTVTSIKITVEVNERQLYLTIIIVAAVLLVAIIVVIILIVKHANKKSDTKSKSKTYNKKRR